MSAVIRVLFFGAECVFCLWEFVRDCKASVWVYDLPSITRVCVSVYDCIYFWKVLLYFRRHFQALLSWDSVHVYDSVCNRPVCVYRSLAGNDVKTKTTNKAYMENRRFFTLSVMLHWNKMYVMFCSWSFSVSHH